MVTSAIRLSSLACCGLAVLLQCFVIAAEPTFELTLVDPVATGYATFQSHNQKVLANQHGYFLTYIRTRDEPFMAQTWRLMRSTDGGKSFGIVYEATHATNPPPIETDAEGNVYLARMDFQDWNAYLYRFEAAKNFQDPAISMIPGGGAGKVALLMDSNEGCLYFAAHNNQFYKLGLDGRVLEQTTLMAHGPNAMQQYPSLRLDEAGNVHYAWTTLQEGKNLYWDIHHMLRPRGAEHWRNLDGRPIATPVIADDTGATTRITGDDEFEIQTWLASFLVKGGKAHFIYMRQGDPAREIYVRRDAATGVEEARVELDGILSLSALLVSADGSAESPLYCVSSKDRRLVTLISRDNGLSWSQYAESTGDFNEYSLGGFNTVAPGGWIIGSFTDQKGGNRAGELESRVHFFRLKAESASL